MVYQQYSISLLVLLLLGSALARVANDLDARDTSPNKNGGLLKRFRELMMQRKDVIQCNQDDIWTLMGSDLGITACSILFSSPNATITSTGTVTEYFVPLDLLRARLLRLIGGQQMSLQLLMKRLRNRQKQSLLLLQLL
jgi:hypothetical protein